jgi:hypothetical protein
VSPETQHNTLRRSGHTVVNRASEDPRGLQGYDLDANLELADSGQADAGCCDVRAVPPKYPTVDGLVAFPLTRLMMIKCANLRAVRMSVQ